MPDYNGFDINLSTTPKPWGAREEQCVKDIIDTLVGDTIDAAAQTSGHLHGKVYASDSVAAIDASTSTSLTLNLRDDIATGLLVKNRNGDSLFTINSSTTTPVATLDCDTVLNGDVGIGITPTNAKLEISIAQGTNGIYVTDADDSDNVRIQQRIDSDGDGVIELYDKDETQAVKINTVGDSFFNGGDVGIGTALPSSLLHVYNGESSGAAPASTDIVLVENNADSYINIQAPNTNICGIMFSDDTRGKGWIGYDHSADYLNFSINSAERMRIDSSGNVGIGKSSLEAWQSTQTVVQIGGNSSIMGLTAEAVASRFYMINNLYRDASDWKRITNDECSMIILGDGNIDFYTDTSDTEDVALTPSLRMRIDESGNVGIGTGATAINGILDLAGSTDTITFDASGNEILKASDSNYLAISGSDASNTGANILLYGDAHATLANVMRIRQNGTDAIYMYGDGGIVLGSASGGSQGAGTLNAVAVYDDGTGPLTDYVFEKHYDKNYTIPEDNEPAQSFESRYEICKTIDSFLSYIKENKCFPAFDNGGAKLSIGDSFQKLLETVETLVYHLDSMNTRLKSLNV